MKTHEKTQLCISAYSGHDNVPPIKTYCVVCTMNTTQEENF